MTHTLTPKQRRFVDEYMIDGNATQAAARAGYSERTAKSQGQRLLTKVDVAAEIKRRQQALAEKTEITAERTLREVGRLAFADVRHLFNEDGVLKPVHELDDDTAAAIQGVDVAKDGALRYKLADKNAATEKLMKHLGMYEKDNRQRGDPLAELLRAIDGKTKSL